MATMTRNAEARAATIHRMVMPDHICPSGLKALDLLKRHGFSVEDHPLRSRDETEAFKAVHGVKTTPQVWIGGEHVGGHEALRRHLGLAIADPKAVTYKPIVAIFAMSAAMALAATYAVSGEVLTWLGLQWFLGFATSILAIQKLRDLDGFADGFLLYDLLAQRQVRYAKAYPFAEALVGVLMIAGALPWLMVPVALFIGGIGAVSVFKAVYVDKRELTCACVGGGSNVPLGFVSLTENLGMVGMALWMATGWLATGMPGAM